MSEQQPRGDQPPSYQPPHGYSSTSQQPPHGGGPRAGAPYSGGPADRGAPGTAADLSPADQRLWATLTHLGGIVAPVLAPLVVFLVLKDRGLFVRDQTREALNAHISLTLYFVGLYIALGIFSVVTLGLAAPLLALPPLLWFLLVLFGILAAVKANQGERYRYPLTLRLVR